MRETELKAVVPDEGDALRRLQVAGARETFRGHSRDRRYDTPARDLRSRDLVLRVRILTPDDGGAPTGFLDFKGRTTYEGGYKHRDETSIAIEDGAALERILGAIGYVVIREIERHVRTFELHGATVRLERYARMDVLVEVEGAGDAIEAAIGVLNIPRAAFTPERLAAFLQRYQERTGTRAAVSALESVGDYRYALDDA